jgi:hypothetical protein
LAFDGVGNSSAQSATVSATTTASSPKYSITVKVTDANAAPLPTARLYLRKGGVLKTTGYSNTSGVWVFSNLVPAADYTVETYKSGYDFGNGKGFTGAAVSANISTGNVTLPIRALP